MLSPYLKDRGITNKDCDEMEETQDVRKRQIFGKLERILLSGDGEIYIVLTKDKIGKAMSDFLIDLEKRYKGKDVIVTFHSLERGRKRGDD